MSGLPSRLALAMRLAGVSDATPWERVESSPVAKVLFEQEDQRIQFASADNGDACAAAWFALAPVMPRALAVSFALPMLLQLPPCFLLVLLLFLHDTPCNLRRSLVLHDAPCSLRRSRSPRSTPEDQVPHRVAAATHPGSTFPIRS